MKGGDSTGPLPAAPEGVQTRSGRYPSLAMKRFVIAAVVFVLVVAIGVVPAADQPAPTSHPSADAVVAYLNQVIDWYRRVAALDALTNDSHEMLLRSAMTQNARQAVKLALRFARAEAAMRDVEARASNAPESK